MAATLTPDGEVTYLSFPVTKVETTPDGDVIVYGKATDGIVDSDRQIVDPDWAAKAVKDWLDTGGNIRVQHDQYRPVGKGIEVDTDGVGGQWVRSLIVEPVAKDLVLKGVLRSYSVGIMHPVIVSDKQAVNGRIIGGELGEISLVDRPANKNCRFELVKAAKDSGDAEWVGKLFGKPIPTPADVAQVINKKVDPNVGGGVDRDKLPAEAFAGPHRSYPIVTPKDVHDAARLIGHADDPTSVKSRIISIARRKGSAFVAQLPDAWKKELGIDKGDAVTEDETIDKVKGVQCPSCKRFNKADATKCTCGHGMAGSDDKDEVEKVPDTEDTTDKGKKPKPAADEGSDGEDEADDSGDDSVEDSTNGDSSSEDDSEKVLTPTPTVTAAVEQPVKKGRGLCGKCGSSMGKKAKFCSACGGKAELTKSVTQRAEPTPADGVTGMAAEPTAPHREPDGPQVEAFEADAQLDTVSDSDVQMKTAMKHQSLGVDTELGSLHDLLCPAYSHKVLSLAHPYRDLPHLDTTRWQQKALDAAAGGTMSEALAAQDHWYAATTLKACDPDVLVELHEELHKSFTDANAGPGTALTPAHVTAQRFKRPYLAAGNARPSFQYAGPNTSPVIAGQIQASQFQRGFLGTGAAANSPANKGDNQGQGSEAETRVYRTTQQRDNARQAMLLLHDHLGKSYQGLCPLNLTEEPAPQPEAPQPAAVTKAIAAEPATTEPVVVEKAAGAAPDMQVLLKSLVPDLVKAAVAEATGPLLTKLETTQQELQEQRKLTKKMRKEIERLGDEPDPRVEPWRGMAQPRALTKTVGTETAPITLASVVDRSQLGKLEILQEQYLTADDPRQREAALKSIMQMRGLN